MTKRTWLTTLATLTFILSILCGYGLRAQEVAPVTPSPVASPEAVPVAPLPGSATEYNPPTPSPSPTVMPISPTATPMASPTPSPSAFPTQPPVAPLPAADPLPTAGEFIDPNGQFRIAILQGFRDWRRIGDAVLIERQDGALAYTALAQPVASGLVAPDNLAEIAKNVFQRGEGFSPGMAQPIPGGVQLDWSGNLTIGGNTQPVKGIIVAKPTNTQVLLLLIAATDAGAEKVPNAAAALIDSLQAL